MNMKIIQYNSSHHLFHRLASLSSFSHNGLPQTAPWHLKKQWVHPHHCLNIVNLSENIFNKVLRLAVDLYQHCYWEVKKCVKQNHGVLFQLGDVELTKAWIADLEILGHPIPSFNQSTKEYEKTCAEKVLCWCFYQTCSENFFSYIADKSKYAV